MVWILFGLFFLWYMNLHVAKIHFLQALKKKKKKLKTPYCKFCKYSQTDNDATFDIDSIILSEQSLHNLFSLSQWGEIKHQTSHHIHCRADEKWIIRRTVAEKQIRLDCCGIMRLNPKWFLPVELNTKWSKRSSKDNKSHIRFFFTKKKETKTNCFTKNEMVCPQPVCVGEWV